MNTQSSGLPPHAQNGYMSQYLQNHNQPHVNSARPIPAGPGHLNGRERNGSASGGQPNWDLARSPPNPLTSNKNTKHVPCKFFRQGQCQAGNACPFMHTMDPQSHQAPCKYFMKGNCKFGAKCALAHYLPNGHRVSKADLNGQMMYGIGRGPDPYNYAAEPVLEPQPYQPPYSSFYPPADTQFALEDEDPDRYNSYTNGHNLDLQSPVLSNYGSPTNDNAFPRASTERIRSALNAPLPNSFNPNSLPNIVKQGPTGTSVPTGFLRSPPATSVSQSIVSPTSNNSSIWSPPDTNGKTTPSFSSSLVQNEASNGQRPMHSAKNRLTRTSMLSASVPTQDWHDTVSSEADLLPTGLHEDVLTPQERARRLSKADQEATASARDLEGLAIPRQSAQSGPSPIIGSPSRFKALFEEQERDKKTKMAVGSPLRGSWFSEEQNTILARPEAQISGISQAISRVDLSRADSAENIATTSTTTTGVRIPGSGLRGSTLSRYDRQISSPSIRPKRIEEEFEGGLFEMDDDSARRSGWMDNQSSNSGSKKSSSEIPRGFAANGGRPMFGTFRPT